MERIYHIHSAVMTGTLPNCSKMAEELNVTPKTVQRDINFMRDHLKLPMVYDDARHGFYYKKSVSEFPVFDLTTEELAALFFARNALLPIRGTKLADVLNLAFQRITRPLQDNVSFGWAELDEAFSVKNPGASKPELETFGKLAKAVLDRKEIEFQYRKMGADKPETRKVQPLHLGEVDNGWYLVGLDLDRNAIRTFALPRLGQLKVTTTKFQRPADFDARAYFKNSFGVWTNPDANAKPFEVRVQFEGYAARVIPERRWHESQQIKELNAKGTRIEVRLNVSSLEDVTRWVLSWGSQAKALAPAELVSAVREEAKALAQSHSK